MINQEDIRLDKMSYDNVYIVDDRNCWSHLTTSCNKGKDLVLCVDFGLKHKLHNLGYSVQFLDHLVANNILAGLNLDTHKFLYGWYKDPSGNDTLEYEGIGIGDALLLNILNDVTYFCHFLFNVYALKSLHYQKLIVSTNNQSLLQVLEILDFDYTSNDTNEVIHNEVVYSFPISRWMDEAINKVSIHKRLKNVLASVFDVVGIILDIFPTKKKKTVYVQSYHPTEKIVERLIGDNGKRVVLPDFSALYGKSKILKHRRVVQSMSKARQSEVDAVLRKYNQARKVDWSYEGIKLSDHLYEIIDGVVDKNIKEAITKVKAVNKYFQKHPLDLAIPVTDLWLENRIVMNYCRKHKAPIFFIANGLLNNPLMNEGRDSDYVNCHSIACKEDYFFNAPNVFALGDPRMDFYANENQKTINRDLPNIVIGAAGYDVTDMNSYLAFEFDFLFDILTSIHSLQLNGHQSKIVLKVRANGYASLYDSFTKEYFSSLNVEIIQDAPFIDVVKRADLYISFYSQTIFEAASLGIPVIYYKKDTQTIYRPFDGQGDLVTATDGQTLMDKIKLFYAGDGVFEAFQKKENLEKYVGPLDGNNLKRNLQFIDEIIQTIDPKKNH